MRRPLVTERYVLAEHSANKNVRRDPDDSAESASKKKTGRRFNRKHFGLSFGLKNGLRFRFDSETCLNYPILNIFLV